MSEKANVDLNVKRFEVVIPYNNEVLVSARKKVKLISAIAMLVCMAVFIGIAIAALVSNTAPSWVIALFASFAALAGGTALYFLCTMKPSRKNDSKNVNCIFYEGYLQIYVDNTAVDNGKSKVLKTCLYRKYPGKQFVAKIVESENKFQIKIFTGTYNGVPQYESHMIPKSIFGDAELNVFKEFLRQKIGPLYVVK